jgi:sodium/potassium-transporting ATPase subunit alpha
MTRIDLKRIKNEIGRKGFKILKRNEIFGSHRDQNDEIKNFDGEYHKFNFKQLTNKFNTSLESGLTSTSAKNRLEQDGKNILSTNKKNILKKILSYLFTGFCGLLWVASLICVMAWKPIGYPPDPTNLGLAVLLLIVIGLQAAFSAFQDWTSDKIMKSIKNMMPSSAQVMRDGVEIQLPASELVVGDLVLLKYGNKVPADIRIIEAHDLKFDKSMLTGESESIEGP